jgi:hypothetical protein
VKWWWRLERNVFLLCFLALGQLFATAGTRIAMCCEALAKNNAKSMTEKNGGHCKTCLQQPFPCALAGGLLNYPTKRKHLFFTAFFFIGLGDNY